MKQRPILFSTPMVQAIIEGRKTQTRRVVKGIALEWLAPEMFNPEFVAHPENSLCLYGNPGDVLWVREKWAKRLLPDGTWDASLGYCYYADNDPLYENIKWKPSIHMPKDAARLFLQITNIRVERLQDISNEDIRREGAAEFGCTTHFLNWQTLWSSINGEQSWNDNPWVWVIEFKRIEKP